MTTSSLPEFAPGYTYPDNDSVPDELRGKTVAEAAAVLQANFLEQNPTPTPPPPVAPPLNDSVTREEFQAVQQAVLAQLARVADESAAQLVERARREHGDVFRRYGGEVAEVLRAVPRGQWTSSVIDNAVTFVRGRHFEELSRDRSLNFGEATMGSTMRSTGGAAPLSIPQKPAPAPGLERWQERAARAGIGQREILAMCKEQDLEPEEFFKMFGTGLVSDAVADVAWGGKRNGGDSGR